MNGSLVNTYCFVFTLHKGNVENIRNQPYYQKTKFLPVMPGIVSGYFLHL